MIVTTTSVLSGKEITEYHGLVSGEAILGANIFRDFFAGIRDIVGGRSGAYEKALREAKEIALPRCKRRRSAWEPTRSSASIWTMKTSPPVTAAGC